MFLGMRDLDTEGQAPEFTESRAADASPAPKIAAGNMWVLFMAAISPHA